MSREKSQVTCPHCGNQVDYDIAKYHIGRCKTEKEVEAEKEDVMKKLEDYIKNSPPF